MARGFSQSVALDILRRDSYNCIYCGSIASVVDHVITYSKGGLTTKQNGAACCKSCNTKKKGKLSEEYLVKGLVHLVRSGEDISWVDNLYTDKLYRMSHAQEYALRLLLQSKLSRSEISFLLDIDRDILEKMIGEMEL